MATSDKVAHVLGERDYWFDNAKSFLIFTVVLGHIVELLLKVVPFKGGDPIWLTAIYSSIYVFHMPVFMLVSGRFAKRRIDSNDWVSVINKVIIPYLICQTVMMLFYNTVGYESTSNFSYLKPYFGLWYLLAIGIYQLITPKLLKITKHKQLLFFLSLAVVLVISFQREAFYGNFQRFFNYYPFFLFGYFSSNFDFKFCKKILFRLLSLLAFVLLVIAVIKNPDFLQVRTLSGKRVYSDVLEFLKISRLDYFLFLIVRYALGFFFLLPVLGLCSSKANIFTPIGTNSTYVYILHLFIIVALTAFGKDYGIFNFCKNEIYSLIMCLVSLPLCFLLVSSPVKKLTGWMVNPKIDIKKLLKNADS